MSPVFMKHLLLLAPIVSTVMAQSGDHSPTDDGYIRHRGQCTSGFTVSHEMVHGIDRYECQQKCDADPDCTAFDWGGKGRRKRCRIHHSNITNGDRNTKYGCYVHPTREAPWEEPTSVSVSGSVSGIVVLIIVLACVCGIGAPMAIAVLCCGVSFACLKSRSKRPDDSAGAVHSNNPGVVHTSGDNAV